MAGSEAPDRSQRRAEAEAARRRRPQGLSRVRARAASLALTCAAVTCPPGHANAQAPGAPPVGELVEALQGRYATISDFAADFEHRITGGVLTTTDVEHGVVRVKRPGRWRFDYTEPERKQFVSDGKTIYAHFPEDREVIVSQVPPDAGASNPAAFLAGRGDLARDFTATHAEAPDAPRGTWVIRLTPIRADANYEWLELAIDRSSLQIRRMATTDFQGAVSTYVFSNLKENQGLSDNVFAFEIPRDTYVTTDDSFGR